MLINSLFLVDSTLYVPSYYFTTMLHLGALFKSQHRTYSTEEGDETTYKAGSTTPLFKILLVA